MWTRVFLYDFRFHSWHPRKSTRITHTPCHSLDSPRQAAFDRERRELEARRLVAVASEGDRVFREMQVIYLRCYGIVLTCEATIGVRFPPTSCMNKDVSVAV